jgi:BlaI family transcriptional regulator, penicillinase repressor
VSFRTLQFSRESTVAEILFTDRELDVMAVLWDMGSGTVAEVKERLSDPLAYTTVLTILRTLEEKGRLAHKEEGRAYRYYPLVQRIEARESHVKRLTRKLFQDSPELLITQLVADESLTKEQLKRLRTLLDARLGRS